MSSRELVVLERFNYEAEPQALFCKSLLDEAGIESLLLHQTIASVMVGQLIEPIELRVAAEDYERAAAIINASFSEEDFEENAEKIE